MQNFKTVAVILSGCGFQDGSEINESVLTLLALDQHNIQASCFAPNITQAKVYDHYNKQDVNNEQRNVLIESARIARGEIQDIVKFNADNFDAIILPGGFGAALNLSSFAQDGTDFNINDDIKAAILAIHQQQKPIAALCIAPVIIAKLINQAKLTIGNNSDVAQAINKMGADHQNTQHSEITIDNHNKIITTPCYMLDSTISQIYTGIDKLVTALNELIK